MNLQVQHLTVTKLSHQYAYPCTSSAVEWDIGEDYEDKR